MKASILFVDDNENILQGLRRNLRSMQQEWDTQFATGGDSALKIMQERHIDVVVSDIRMPGMDGADLLKRIKEVYPHTVRMVLSGQCEEAVILRLLEASHQYMAKPFDTGEIILAIHSILSFKAKIQDEGLKKFITNLTALPTLPSIHKAIAAELQSAAPATHTLEELFLRDISLLAKFLQIMNSSYFGVSQDISTIAYVWELLSLDKVRTLILQDHIIAPLNKELENDPFVRDLWKLSLVAGETARAIAKSENLPQKVADKVYVAGMLHAIGALVLYEYQRQEKGTIACEGLLDAAGAPDHYALVGGFLLSLWGLPRDIRYAVLNHAAPGKAGDDGDKNILAIVHVAQALARAKIQPGISEAAYLHEDFLRQTGVSDKIEGWKMAAALV